MKTRTSTRLLTTIALIGAAAFAVAGCKKTPAADSSAPAASDATAAPMTPDSSTATAPATGDTSAMSSMSGSEAMSSSAPMSATSPNGSGREGDITPPSSNGPG